MRLISASYRVSTHLARVQKDRLTIIVNRIEFFQNSGKFFQIMHGCAATGAEFEQLSAAITCKKAGGKYDQQR